MLIDRELGAPVARPLVVPADAWRSRAPFTHPRTYLGKAVAWLAARRPFTIALMCAYVLFIVLAHDQMQRPAYWAQGKLSHESWNNLVTAFGVPLLLAVCLWCLVRLRRLTRPGVGLFYLATTAALCAISFRTLLVMNIEIVHFLQYAILAVLLFAITGRASEVMLWSTLIALMDEAYQYFVLYADRGIHFDFNDVILNAIGSGFGLVLLLTAGVTVCLNGKRERYSLRRLLKSPACAVATACLVTGIVLACFGVLRLLPPETETAWAIVLRRGGPATMFWTPTTWGKTFHEVQPFEWVFIAFGLITLYSALDFLRVDTPRET